MSRFDPRVVALLTVLSASPAISQSSLTEPPSIHPITTVASAPLASDRPFRRYYDPGPPGGAAVDSPLRAAIDESDGAVEWRTSIIGAGIGAAVGLGGFFLTSDGCWRRIDSMCELAVPLYVVAGTAVGGLLGYALGR